MTDEDETIDVYGFSEYEICEDGETVIVDGKSEKVSPMIYNLLQCQHDFIHDRVLFVDGVEDDEDYEIPKNELH